MFGPYGLIIGAAVFAIATAGAYLQGRSDGGNACEAAAAREQRVAEVATAAAAQAAASAIAGIKIQNRTIQNEVQREISERVVYRDCGHSPDQLQRLNAALAGSSAPAGSGLVPTTGAAD